MKLLLPDWLRPEQVEHYKKEWAWRATIFGPNPPMDNWDDYINIGPAQITFSVFNRLGRTRDKGEEPCARRLHVVMVQQAFFKRRFWSKKTLVRLLMQLVCEVYVNTEEQQHFPSDDQLKLINHNVFRQQESAPNNSFLLPPMRPVPQITLFPKLEYLALLMKESLEKGKTFVERDNLNPNEFLQFWMKYVRDLSNLPKTWFSWHNDEFDEHFEYPHMDEQDCGDWQLELINDTDK